jgi:hypothetical protein
VSLIVASARKGWLPAYWDATMFKVAYSYGLRFNEVRQPCVLAETVGVGGTVGNYGVEDDAEAAPPTDYTALLIAPDALGLPGEPYSAPAPTQNPQGVPGVSTLMVNRSDTRSVGDRFTCCPTRMPRRRRRLASCAAPRRQDRDALRVGGLRAFSAGTKRPMGRTGARQPRHPPATE